ncbi:MAG: hypothetical protein J5511_04915 [Bacilli bacterium]|nr:hypothetical protein [Bacilli bacterium]
MKNKTLLTLSVAGFLTIGSTAAIVFAHTNIVKQLTRATNHELVLDGNTEISEEDYGYYYSATVKTNEFDLIGYTPVSNKLGNIKKRNYNGVYDYNGMVYNRSVINGFTSMTIKYTGASLYYKLTDYLMQDMVFDKANLVTSNIEIQVANNEAYFILYTDDTTTGVDIESITLNCLCDSSIDNEMIFNENSNIWSARSSSSKKVWGYNFVELTNNPGSTQNNYSTGSHGGHDDVWYRWNGQAFRYSSNLGTRFSINTTILGNISQAVNAYGNAIDNYFNYSVWPEIFMTDADNNKVGENWEYAYIGNDNYEPLGKDSPDRIHQDLYGNYSYSGRFFTTYKDYGTDGWQFADPDTTIVKNGTKTYREAYNTFNLPYWYIRYEFEADPVTGNVSSKVFVNGFQISYYEDFFDNYQEGYNFHINTYHMHCVNYGTNSQNANKYKGVFTYPRITTL